jgi:acetyltransferase-like isoleucine patch superfamily enzyme
MGAIKIFLRIRRILKRKINKGVEIILHSIPYFKFIKDTKKSGFPITFKMWFFQKILGFNKKVYWPVHFTSKINQYKHILIGVESYPGCEPGCYIQGIGTVKIGDYTRIAQNVGIISSNHDLHNNSEHNVYSKIIIGNYCWIGMNSVILPDVELGDFTVVGAGSIVTKSFKEGYCVIAGNPAKIIKYLKKENCVRFTSKNEYIGYYNKTDFDKYRRDNLWV